MQTLIISIHDVNPLTRETCTTILADLAEIAALGDGTGSTVPNIPSTLRAPSVSLLVTPNHHNRAPIREDRTFADWLCQCAASRHEIVLHGYHHARPPRDGETLFAKITNTFYTAGEGEFLDLPYNEARELLARGRSDLAASGITDVKGFIAPAWLLGAEATRAVRDEGFAYTTRLDRVELFSGVDTLTQSLVWSTRARWRRAASLKWNLYLFHRLAQNPVMRIGIHPTDWEHPAIRRQILALIQAACITRTATTYGELEEQRQVACTPKLMARG